MVETDTPGHQVEIASNLLVEHRHPHCKWCVLDCKSTSVTIIFPEPILISGYALVSANDCLKRGPSEWTVLCDGMEMDYRNMCECPWKEGFESISFQLRMPRESSRVTFNFLNNFGDPHF